MDRFEARKVVVADLEAEGLLEKIEDHAHTVPYGDRGGVPIEPYLTVQWYVDAETLAKPAIAAVEDGRTKFVPENWSKTYFEWMRNIQPWCISRQLWWGHRIPAWYGLTARSSSQMMRRPLKRKPAPIMAKINRWSRTPTSWTPGFPLRSGRSQPSAGQKKRLSWRNIIRATCS